MASSDLARRVGVAAVGIPVAVLLVWFGGWPMGITLALLAAIGATELFAMGEALGIRPFRPLGAALAAGLVVFATDQGGFRGAAPYQFGAVVGVAFVAGLACVALRKANERPLECASITLFAPVYVGGGLAFAALLRGLDPAGSSWLGAAFVAYPLTVTWVGDTAAYFGGMRWGRRKLSPAISPNKTVEGAIAGFAGSVAVGALFGWLVFDMWHGTGIGAALGAVGAMLISPAAQVGDLAESLFKRQAGMKDSGRLLPGHGGVMDRFDAVLMALPVAYVYLAALVPRIVTVTWP
ncbi:MAG TPA: phosphatidate cytidylyltransferase [Longimicrobiales bacterium]|nr:phosphatidate cytidylyltransferase [Longimicrobiales bacterium]